jgi:hypothetical protein
MNLPTPPATPLTPATSTAPDQVPYFPGGAGIAAGLERSERHQRSAAPQRGVTPQKGLRRFTFRAPESNRMRTITGRWPRHKDAGAVDATPCLATRTSDLGSQHHELQGGVPDRPRPIECVITGAD